MSSQSYSTSSSPRSSSSLGSASSNDSSHDYQGFTLDAFEVIINILERYTGYSRELLPMIQAEKFVVDRLHWSPAFAHRVLAEVYPYWVKKRERLQKPLCRKFWPQTPSNDTNPHLVFR